MPAKSIKTFNWNYTMPPINLNAHGSTFENFIPADFIPRTRSLVHREALSHLIHNSREKLLIRGQASLLHEQCVNATITSENYEKTTTHHLFSKFLLSYRRSKSARFLEYTKATKKHARIYMRTSCARERESTIAAQFRVFRISPADSCARVEKRVIARRRRRRRHIRGSEG